MEDRVWYWKGSNLMSPWQCRSSARKRIKKTSREQNCAEELIGFGSITFTVNQHWHTMSQGHIWGPCAQHVWLHSPEHDEKYKMNTKSSKLHNIWICYNSITYSMMWEHKLWLDGEENKAGLGIGQLTTCNRSFVTSSSQLCVVRLMREVRWEVLGSLTFNDDVNESQDASYTEHLPLDVLNPEGWPTIGTKKVMKVVKRQKILSFSHTRRCRGQLDVF